MANEEHTQILNRLDAILLLLTRLVPPDAEELLQRDQIRLLSKSGIGPTDIGRMLGKSASAISSEISKMNKVEPRNRK